MVSAKGRLGGMLAGYENFDDGSRVGLYGADGWFVVGGVEGDFGHGGVER